MIGELADDGTARVRDASEASTVYARGFFGTPDGVELRLDRYEAVYLAEMGRIELGGPRGRVVAWSTALRRATRAEPGFAVRYLVYRDLRQRGYVVRRGSTASFSVLPRGGTLNKTPARYWVQTCSERSTFDLASLFELADRATAARKTLLLALVDEESDLTYYRLRRPQPHGALPARPLGQAAEAWLLEDRVVVFDPPAVAELAGERAYGSRVGSRVELSLLEAAHLGMNREIVLRDARSGRAVPLTRLMRIAAKLDPRFRERLSAYRDLRKRQLVVKTGFKYGAHFRAYPRNPEHSHARYLVHAVPDAHRAAWPEIAGAVRVAQGVRKEFLLAGVAAADSVRFLGLERVRP